MLVSSHVLAEVAQSVDEVVVIARGRLRAQGPHRRGARRRRRRRHVRAQPGRRAPGRRAGAPAACTSEPAEPGALLVHGAGPETVGRTAGEEGITVFELYARSRSLEDAFFELTGEEG